MNVGAYFSPQLSFAYATVTTFIDNRLRETRTPQFLLTTRI